MVPAWALFGLISSSVTLGARVQPETWGNAKEDARTDGALVAKALEQRMMFVPVPPATTTYVETVEATTTTKTQLPTTTVQLPTTTVRDGVSSYGDPHTKNIYGQRFDIKRPGNHSFLVLPRGADTKKANLYIDAMLTRRGELCTGQLFITGLRLSARWVDALGGDIELSAATDMFNAPEVVGLKLGNSGNISLQEFAARIPKHMLDIAQFRPELPSKLNTHVNTLHLQFHLGPSTVKIGWAHEKLMDGFANWLWLEVSGLGTAEEVGGILGSDDHSAVQKVPADVLAACQNNPMPAAGFVGKNHILGGWASAEP